MEKKYHATVYRNGDSVFSVCETRSNALGMIEYLCDVSLMCTITDYDCGCDVLLFSDDVVAVMSLTPVEVKNNGKGNVENENCENYLR